MGWINGITAIIHLLFGCTFGLFLIYKSKKTNAKLLFYLGLSIFFLGLISLGNILDFMTILFTGRNMDNSYGLKIILGYMWFGPAFTFAAYVAVELLIPEKKWYLVAIYSLLGVICEILLFLDPLGSVELIYPATQGEDIIDDNIAFNSASVNAL